MNRHPSYTRSPVFSSLRPTNHWMFEARFEQSVTRRQHRVAPPTINWTSHFQLIMRRLAKLHMDQNVNKTRSIWRKNVKQHWNDAVSSNNQCWPQRNLLVTINVRDTEFLTDDTIHLLGPFSWFLTRRFDDVFRHIDRVCLHSGRRTVRPSNRPITACRTFPKRNWELGGSHWSVVQPCIWGRERSNLQCGDRNS